MSVEAIFLAIFGALVSGAGVVWVFVNSIIMGKDKIIAEKDIKISEKETKMDNLQDQITELKVSLARLEGKIKTTADLMTPFQDVLKKLEEIRVVVKKTTKKSKTVTKE